MWGIGVDVDQSFLGPHILTSAVIRLDVAVYAAIRRLVKGSSRPGATRSRPRKRRRGLGKISPEVPRSFLRQLDRIRRQIIAGKIDGPSAPPRTRSLLDADPDAVGSARSRSGGADSPAGSARAVAGPIFQSDAPCGARGRSTHTVPGAGCQSRDGKPSAPRTTGSTAVWLTLLGSSFQTCVVSVRTISHRPRRNAGDKPAPGRGETTRSRRALVDPNEALVLIGTQTSPPPAPRSIGLRRQAERDCLRDQVRPRVDPQQFVPMRDPDRLAPGRDEEDGFRPKWVGFPRSIVSLDRVLGGGRCGRASRCFLRQPRRIRTRSDSVDVSTEADRLRRPRGWPDRSGDACRHRRS